MVHLFFTPWNCQVPIIKKTRTFLKDQVLKYLGPNFLKAETPTRQNGDIVAVTDAEADAEARRGLKRINQIHATLPS